MCRLLGVVLVVALVLAGCGGSSRQTALTGCKGLTAVRQAGSYQLLFDRLGDHATPVQVCRQFGAPRQITHDTSGIVVWHFANGNEAASLSFNGDCFVSGEWSNTARADQSDTYSITHSEIVIPNAR